ncbi:hypothetical protein ACFQU2_02665 [Siccirubricoccus deserti]
MSKGSTTDSTAASIGASARPRASRNATPAARAQRPSRQSSSAGTAPSGVQAPIAAGSRVSTKISGGLASMRSI